MGPFIKMYSTDKTQSRPGSRQFEIFQNPSPNKKFSIVFMFLFSSISIQISNFIKNLEITIIWQDFMEFGGENSGSKIDGGLADLSIR